MGVDIFVIAWPQDDFHKKNILTTFSEKNVFHVKWLMHVNQI